MAAKQDSIDGCLALGYFYLNSKENFNFNDAEFWFLKALDLGSIDAQFSLGELYFKVFSHEVEELENSYGYHISYEDFFADYEAMEGALPVILGILVLGVTIMVSCALR